MWYNIPHLEQQQQQQQQQHTESRSLVIVYHNLKKLSWEYVMQNW